MFTGIIEATGTIRSVDERDGGLTLEIDTSLASEMHVGASIAVNGVCLTAVSEQEETLRLDLVVETLARSNLGELAPGDSVNLERPLQANGRLDGHIVQGHVDTVGTVLAVVPEGAGTRMVVALEPEFRKYVAEKGSVAVDGVSLTVAALNPEGFEVALIPHTLDVTTLSLRVPGNKVNLEFDVLAKYVERMLRQ
jgi:riboflavin synthase